MSGSYFHWKTGLPLAGVIGLAMILGLLQGCAGKPEPAALPDHIPAAWTFSSAALPMTRGLLDLFDDPGLRQMVDQALKNNPDLKAAALRVEAERQRQGARNFDSWPTASATVTRTRDNQGFNPLTGDRTLATRYRAGLDISWEIDVWGRLADRRGAELARLDIQRLDMESAYDSLAARVIQGALDMAGTRETCRLTRNHVSMLEKIEAAAAGRYRDGVGRISDLAAARSRTRVARARLCRLEESHRSLSRHLTVLMGQIPDPEAVEQIHLTRICLPVFSAPARALSGRPDIRAALRQIDANRLAALAADKAMLPALTLGGGLEKQGKTVSLLRGSDLLWRLVGSLAQPVFQGTRLIREARAVRLEADASVWDLKNTVLSALREVEDRAGLEADRHARQTHLDHALSQAETVARDYTARFKKGLVSLVDLLSVMEQQIDIQTQRSSVRTRRMTNRVDLALALGAGR